MPLDFDNVDGDKASPKEETIDYSDEKYEKIVVEETELYTPSYFICDEIYDFQKNRDQFKAYQVLNIDDGKYLTIGCEMVLDDSNENAIKLF